jgi:capsular exopolysaccharide synthesis family protein
MGVVTTRIARRPKTNVNHSLAKTTHTNTEITLGDLMQVYRRRRRVFYGFILGFLTLGALYCIVCTRRYSSAAVIQVQKESPDGLGLDNLMTGPSDPGDALNAALDLQTESEVLQSDTLALKVIQDLDLEHSRDFRGSFSPIGWAMGLISPKGTKDPRNASLEDSPARRTHVLKVFSKNLKVKVDSGTRLIDISYLSSDARTSATVVNHLIQGLTDYNFQTRLSATSTASTWLSAQLGDLRKQSESLQGKVANLQKDMGVVSLGESETDGKPQIYSAVLDRLQQQTTALSAAESNRIMKGALYEVMKSGDADLVSGLSGTGIGSSSQAVSNSFALIQTLRTQQATLQQQIAHDSVKFGPDYPTQVEQRASLDGVNRAIAAEIQRVASRAKNDYEIARQTEQDTRATYESARRDAEQLNDKAVEFTIARQEAADSRGLYQGLLKRLKEGGVLEGLRSSNVTVVDPGRVPDKPKTPNVPIYLAIALVAGVFTGGSMSLLMDTMDDKIQDIDELQLQYGLPLLGIVPFAKKIKGGRQLEAESSASPFSEAVRGLRTSLMLSKSGAPPKVVLVTSAVQGEGKSTLSKSLAVLVAKQGRRVLLVEADLRRPQMHEYTGMTGTGGLSVALSTQEDGENGLGASLSLNEVATLTLLPAGPIPPDPAELLDSARMRCLVQAWREQFDLVILDGPPALPVTDALALAGMADTTILVARSGLTARSSLRRACQLLEQHVDSRHLRIVMNGVKPGSHAYSHYYGYAAANSFYKGDRRERA